MKKILIASLALLVSGGALAAQYPDHMTFRITVFNKDKYSAQKGSVVMKTDANGQLIYLSPEKPEYTIRAFCDRSAPACPIRSSFSELGYGNTMGSVDFDVFQSCPTCRPAKYAIRNIRFAGISPNYTFQQADQDVIEIRYTPIPQ